MDIYRLDHINLRTSRLSAMMDWYSEVLGFESGDRPNFPFPGAWMYRHGHALVHLVEVSADPDQGEDLHLEHAAFSSTRLKEFRAHLKAKAVQFKEVQIDDFGILQVNVWDPDGNHLHIDFDMSEAND